jgi:hypothetical protein
MRQRGLHLCAEGCTVIQCSCIVSPDMVHTDMRRSCCGEVTTLNSHLARFPTQDGGSEWKKATIKGANQWYCTPRIFCLFVWRAVASSLPCITVLECLSGRQPAVLAASRAREQRNMASEHHGSTASVSNNDITGSGAGCIKARYALKGSYHNRYKEGGRRLRWFVQRARSNYRRTMNSSIKEHCEATAVIN